MDLGRLWSERRWRLLLNLIDHLPRNSFFIEAVGNDDELAKLAPASSGPHVERLSQWSHESELLAVIIDRLGALVSVEVAAAGGKPPKIEPYARPVTAAQRARTLSPIGRHEALVARLMPKQ